MSDESLAIILGTFFWLGIVGFILWRTSEFKQHERDLEEEKPEWMWGRCLKQVVTCVIYTSDGQIFTATNLCACVGMSECPRVTAGAKTGEQYELCGPPIHAEEAAIKEMRLAGADGTGGVAVLYGHTYACGACQQALVAAGIRTITIAADPEPPNVVFTTQLMNAKRKLYGEPFDVTSRPVMHEETARKLGLKPGQYVVPET